MFYITQLIYIVKGREAVFNEFESLAIPLISKYNGRLLLRVRPDENSFIEANMERPDEIHLVVFESEEDFVRFAADEERKKFLHLKESSIRASLLIKGEAL